jgi:hypothetical protein
VNAGMVRSQVSMITNLLILSSMIAFGYGVIAHDTFWIASATYQAVVAGVGVIGDKLP